MVVRWTYLSNPEGEDASSVNGDGASVKTTSFRVSDGKITEIWEDYDALEQRHIPSNRKEGLDTLLSFRVIGGWLAAYIGIPAILLYPVGLAVFAFQLLLSKNLEFLTALYAASLVPATLLVGYGLKVFVMPIFVSFVVSLATAHLRVWWLLKVRKKLTVTVTELERRTRRTLMSLAGGSLVAMAAALLWLAPIPLFSAFTITFSLVPAVLVGGWSGILIASDYVQHTSRPERNNVLFGRHLFLRGVREGWIARGLSSAYLGSAFCASVVILAIAAAGQGPDLPRVIISTRGEQVEALNKTPPLLLAHSEGYWHVLTSVEAERTKYDTEQDAFLSIPDDEVKRATVIEDPIADLSVVKTSSHGTIGWVGDIVTYTLETANNGPDPATGVRLFTELPQGVEHVSATASQGDCNGNIAVHGERNIECKLGSLTAEDTATVRIKVRLEEVGILHSTTIVQSKGFDYYTDNSKETEYIRAKLDANPPETGATIPRKPNSNGWYNTDIPVRLGAKDNGGSGVKEIVYSLSGAQNKHETTYDSQDKLAVTAEGETKVTYFAKDAAGNTEPEKTLSVKLDKTKPTVKCETPNGIWQNKDVSISCTASDSVSGLENATNADFFLSTALAEDPVEAGKENDDASTNSTDICDAAGNCKNVGPIGDIKVDKKAPVVRINKPVNGAKYKLGEPVDADYHCTDGGSGVEACVGSITNGSSIDTSSIGTKTFQVTANDKAGNTTSAAHSYSVTYSLVSEGSIHLVEAPPSMLHIARAGDTVLVQFKLGGYKGLDVFAVGYPLSKEIKCTEQGRSTTIGGNNVQFMEDSGSGHYTYEWDTSDDWSGTCRRLLLKLNDGTQYLADFRFTR